MTEGEWHKKARKEIIKRYENKGYMVKSSHGDATIKLSRGATTRSTFLSDADVVVFQDDRIVEIAEIQDGHIRPKDMIGIIKTTDLCNRCKIAGEIYDLSDVKLVIIYKKQKDESRKSEQFQLIKDNLKVDGCVRTFDFEEIE